ncbi:hypothetical protein ACFQ6Q_09890 [Streptomyces sp. NPDC056437]|uniref:hypothetical protein n=1 Tax=Streptomyces sp. NPDC056437 TaxID=3345816 RepID=UPI0036B3FB2C
MTMNVWTVGTTIVGLGLAVWGILAIPTAPAAPAVENRITSPSEADRVDMCLPAMRGTGPVPDEGSLWLVVHGVGNQGYYLARQVQPGTDEGWDIGPTQIGSKDSKEGQRYELLLWRLDPQLTGVVSHMIKDMRVFDGLPPGASLADHKTVIRTADKNPC